VRQRLLQHFFSFDSTAQFRPWPSPWNFPLLLQLLDLGQPVGLLGRVISSSQGLYLYTNTEKRTHNTNTKHQCPEWDSNPRSWRPRANTVHSLYRSATVTGCCSNYSYENCLKLRNPTGVILICKYFFFYLSISMALQPFVGPWPLFSVSGTFTQSVGPLGREISPSQGRYLHIGQHKQRINANRHLCPMWDSNPWS
jgi:hypothetical protein